MYAIRQPAWLAPRAAAQTSKRRSLTLCRRLQRRPAGDVGADPPSVRADANNALALRAQIMPTRVLQCCVRGQGLAVRVTERLWIAMAAYSAL